jgi:hypothetical protein
MSDDDRHDELRRRLADEGPASAPPDLAPEVMRRVRSEPRRERRSYLRPAATLIAAALLALAAVVGIAHLGNGQTSSSSSGGGGAAGEAVSQAPTASSPQKDMATGLTHLIIRHVAHQRLESIFAPSRVPACPAGKSIKAAVPAPQLRQVEDRLRGAAADAVVGPDARDVELHRAPKGQTRITITCP